MNYISTAGTIVREWMLPGDHILKLVHDLTKHAFELKIDNIELSRGIVSPYGDPVKVEFHSDGSHGTLHIVKGGTKNNFSYNLVIDGINAPESVGRVSQKIYFIYIYIYCSPIIYFILTYKNLYIR